MALFDALRASLRRSLTIPESVRNTGLPTSSNGASSMHLHWRDLPAACEAVEVDSQILGTPPTPHLRFWALQASFVDGSMSHGAGHLGLQWIDGYPGHTAINWGGYRTGGGELSGTESALPSARGNVNTRSYSWAPGQTYGLRIDRSGADGNWRGSVVDRATGEATAIRELACPGANLNHIVMWSEIFAPCDAPSLSVAWSNATAFTSTGAHRITNFSVSYQTVGDGGCSNTNVTIEPDGRVLQTTNVERRTQPGSIVMI